MVNQYSLPASHMKKSSFSRLLWILSITLLCVVVCVFTFCYGCYRRYCAMIPVAASSCTWVDLTGEDELQLENLQKNQLVSIHLALTSGSLGIKIYDESGEVCPLYKNPFESGDYLLIVSSDGTYTFHFEGTQAYFRIDTSTLKEVK